MTAQASHAELTTAATAAAAFERNLCSDTVPDGLMLATRDGYVIGVHAERGRCLEWTALTARGAYRHADWHGVLMLEFELFDDALLTSLRWATRSVPGGEAASAPAAGPWTAGERDRGIREREVERAGLRAIDTAVGLGLFEQAPREPAVTAQKQADEAGPGTLDDEVIRRMQDDMAAVVAMAARARPGAARP